MADATKERDMVVELLKRMQATQEQIVEELQAQRETMEELVEKVANLSLDNEGFSRVEYES